MGKVKKIFGGGSSSSDKRTAEAIREQNTLMQEQNKKLDEERKKAEDLRKSEYLANQQQKEAQADMIKESDQVNQAQRKPRMSMDTSTTDDELDIQWLDDPTKKKGGI